MAVPSRVVREVGSLAERAVSEVTGERARRAAPGSTTPRDAAARVGRISRAAAKAGSPHLRAGSRLYLRLSATPTPRETDASRIAVAARKAALALLEHPDVLLAYWDGGLARLVVQMTEDAVTDEILDKVGALTAEHGLVAADDDVDEVTRPTAIADVRTAAVALGADAVGIAVAVGGRALGLKRSPKIVASTVSLLREDPRAHRVLHRSLGRTGTEFVMAAAHAAAHGAGQSPVSLVLDAALRTSHLVEAVARAAMEDSAQDALWSPDRVSPAGDRPVDRPARVTPADRYVTSAVTGSAFGAAVTMLLRRNADETASVMQAGTPKPARYGPAAYRAGLGSALAREGVLTRDPERLRLLELVDTVVLHPSALRGTERVVREVHPSAPGWDDDRLWQVATAALEKAERAHVELRPVPGHQSQHTGLMTVSDQGTDVGTVIVDRELDPLAESVLDAARRGGLHVVLVDDPTLGDFATMADEVADREEPLSGIVHRLRKDERVVLTVARLRAEDDAAGDDSDILAGLLRSDLAVAVADRRSAMVWSADVLVLHGLAGVWRLLTAVPAAQAVSRRSTTLAQAGAALAGLLLVDRGSARRGTRWWETRLRLSPVDIATAGALLVGWRAAWEVATTASPVPSHRVRWHALSPEDALSRLSRQARHAPTAQVGSVHAVRAAVRTLPALAPLRLTVQYTRAVLAELNDPLTPILAIGAAASAILGSTVDAALVAGAIGMNAAVGGIQRARGERALTALSAGQNQKARLITDPATGATDIVDATGLVPGDVIELEVGDVVPADARLLDLNDLEVDESPLTGESLPVIKQLAATPNASISNRRCMVFEGTTVVAGQGRAVVVATGEQTETGRASALASRTPAAGGAQARLKELTAKALPLTLVGGVAVAGLSLLRGRPLREALRGGVAVAVAAVPEGLPLVATAAQTAGARRLTRRGVLVRTPRALEALGRANTVCFDKTGTLTQNRLHVVRLTTPDGVSHTPGDGEAEAVLRAAARACPHEGDDTANHAHATDEAVLAAAPPDADWSHVAGQPFEASRGYAAAVGTNGAGARLLVVKGAPEVVLASCRNTGEQDAATADALAGEGLRVLAIAQREVDTADVVDAPLMDLEFLGFLALADVPRTRSEALVTRLRAAGVSPVMLTGDHPLTAHAIAVDLGWPTDTVVITGDQLATLDRAGRARAVRDVGVIARVAPEQKVQVVEALRDSGRVVAMVGDGANDAAAIRAADVGVGLATRGSAAARGAADLVLTTGDLTVLVDAVAEGRALWRSVADAVSILIGGNAGEVGFSILGTLVGGTAPLSPRQVLLVNLLTDMFPAMAVAVTPSGGEPAADHAAALGAPVGAAVLGESLDRQIQRRGIITGIGASTAWTIGKLTPGSARRTSTMALCGVVGAQLTQTLIGRHRSPLVLATTLGSAAVLAAIIQTPVLSQFFGCTPLGPVAWAGVGAAVGVAVLGPWLLPRAEGLVGAAAARLRPAVDALR
ncbi:cation-translocating P-type ATPase [Allokutzneria oryzae]|uniref:HAD-IC family P-type ATPase n=1 Tax=Allokutzneria oryzae TaxID=1378989 RepID=A0ABV6A787_9PSEU